jgi:hypothetical protein
MKCKYCNSTSYFIKDLYLSGDKHYALEAVCRKCGRITTHKISLISSVDKYKIITVNGKNQMLHRWVWETYNKMMLKPGEIVHHINGDKRDNCPKNLLVLLKKKHSKNAQYEFLINKIDYLEKENKCLKEKLKKFMSVKNVDTSG